MPALGGWAETAVINALLRGVDLTAPTAWYLALYKSDPTYLDVGLEVSGGSYARQSILFGVPSGGVSANTNEITFPTATNTWGNVTHAAIRDASSGGNLLFYGSLVVPRYITAGDVLKFLVDSVVATIS